MNIRSTLSSVRPRDTANHKNPVRPLPICGSAEASRRVAVGTGANRLVRGVILALLVACASYCTAVFGGALLLRSAMVWPLWPGCALLVGILLLTPQKRWPSVLAAGLAGFILYDIQAGLPIRSTFVLVAADSIEILLAAFGVTYALGPRPRLSNLASLAKYAVFAVILAPGFAACVGAGAFGGNYILSWKISFFTEALALLSVTPAILSWADIVSMNKSRGYYMELALSLVVLAAVASITFLSPNPSSDLTLLYLPVPILLWSALRFGILGISTSLNVVAFFSIWAAIHQRGPFAAGGYPLDDVQRLQLFFLIAASSFMVLAAVVEQNQQALRESRESEARFRLVADTTPVKIWMSGPDKLCTYFNQRWLQFTGRPIEAELGNGWTEAVHKEDLPACLETYTSAFDRRVSFEMEYRLRRHDGEYRWILDLGVPRFNPDGSFAGYIGSCSDVTERKLAEEALSNVSGKLIEAHEEERTWIARELHDDVNQRVAFLAVTLDILKRRLPPVPSDPQRYLQEAKEQLNDLSQTVQALSHRLHSSKLDYLGLTAATESFCREFAERYQVQIERRCDVVPKSLHREVAVCLFRVLQEALQNARKHSGSKHFLVLLQCSPGEIRLSVSDFGTGFDAAKSSSGEGLGIISMRERLKLVDGELSIESDVHNGTTIRAFVPITPTVSAAKAGA